MSSSLWQQLSSKRSTRVLVLHPLDRKNPEAICASLEEVNIDQQPQFEAVSWTWGPEARQQRVYVDGQEILVREHLHQFLLKLRGPEYERRLWVDALCINQQDPVEKSHQVAMMGEIFSSARKVLAWVGPEADGSKEALRWLREAAWKSRVDKIGIGVGPRQKETARVLMAFLNRPWFGRTWIVQEVVLAKKVEIHCGSDMVKWDDLSKAAVSWRYNREESEGESEASHFEAIAPRLALLDERRRVYWWRDNYVTGEERGRSRDISDFVYHSRSFECSDPRDRIYALISLETNPSRVRLKPDYTLTLEQTLVSVFRQKQPDFVPDLDLLTGDPYLHSMARFTWKMAEALGFKDYEHVAGLLVEGIREGDKGVVWRGAAQEIRSGNVHDKQRAVSASSPKLPPLREIMLALGPGLADAIRDLGRGRG